MRAGSSSDEGTMEDITQRKEGERALAESEERYRTVIEHSNDGIGFARGGKLEYVNPRFLQCSAMTVPTNSWASR